MGRIPEDLDYLPMDEDESTCDCCNRELNGYDGTDPCPFCCSHSYAPGSEECDWCIHGAECAEMYASKGLI